MKPWCIRQPLLFLLACMAPVVTWVVLLLIKGSFLHEPLANSMRFFLVTNSIALSLAGLIFISYRAFVFCVGLSFIAHLLPLFSTDPFAIIAIMYIDSFIIIPLAVLIITAERLLAKQAFYITLSPLVLLLLLVIFCTHATSIGLLALPFSLYLFPLLLLLLEKILPYCYTKLKAHK